MRLIGLLFITTFFPLLAHAAAPSLTTYTVSHDTIYPSAAADAGLATTTSIDTAFSEQAKVSIKIISASGTTIKSLYSSSSVTNPTPKIWDGTNTAGGRADDGTYTILIAATSTASGDAMSDSSKTINIASADSPTPDTAADSVTTTAAPSSEGAPAEYIPIPALHIITTGDRIVSSGAETAFTAVVYDGRGNKRDDALITWSFGDGMRRTGASLFHQYYDPGEYLTVVHATTADGGDASRKIVVTVKDARIKIAGITARGITIANNDSRTLDLSLWRLSMGGKEFKIPADTQILAGRATLFPSQIIELPISNSAALLYPSGEVAAEYPSVPVRQPSGSAVSYTQVSEVEPAISARATAPIHEEAVQAPAVTNELAAVGAVPSADSPVLLSRFGELFKSPWTLGFLGVVALAGGALILL